MPLGLACRAGVASDGLSTSFRDLSVSIEGEAARLAARPFGLAGGCQY